MKGYVYAFLASLLIGAAFILSSIVVKTVSPITASFYLFVFASILAVPFIFFTRRNNIGKIKKYWKKIAFLGFLNSIAVITWFTGLSLMGPAVLSFLLRFVTVFIIILSIVFLKEKFNRYEAVGIAIIIIGALTISYSDVSLATGTIVALISSVFFAITQFKVKDYVKKIDPIMLNGFRLMFTLPFVFFYSLISGSIVPISISNAVLIFFTALLVSILGISLMYKAYEIADLSKIASIAATQPLIILVYAFIIFSTLPTGLQLVGGAIILAGTFILIFSRKLPKLEIFGAG